MPTPVWMPPAASNTLSSSQLLSRLTEEVDAGGSELRQATIAEVQRIRSGFDAAVRRTKTRIRLGA